MKAKKSWRLSKTLSRRIEIRPIENEDVKYAWAAYKQGGLKEFEFPPDLSASAFKDEFEKFVLTRVNGAWTILANTKSGFMPIGVTLGNWGVSFMIMSGTEWFPWASKRNILEGAVAMVDRLRKQFPMICFATEEHKRIFETCCMHGIAHRVGTSYSLGQKMTVFEARTN